MPQSRKLKPSPYLKQLLTSEDPTLFAGPTLQPVHRRLDSHTQAAGRAEDLLALLRKVPFFSGCDEAELQHVLRTAQLCHVKRYGVLIRQGTLGSTFYMLLDGELHCANDKGVDVRLSGQGLLLGEGALVARCPRAANVIACCNSRLLCWKADQLQGLRGIDHTVAQMTVVCHALRHLPFFCNLPEAQLKALSAIMAVDSFPGSSVVFHEGELDDQLFLLLEGAVNVYAGAPPSPWGDGPPDASLISHHEAAGAGSGANDEHGSLWVGEMALWANRPPNASVVSTEPSKLLILTQARPRPAPLAPPAAASPLWNSRAHLPPGQTNFDRFMAAVPEFRALFTTHTNAFARLSQLTHAKQQLFGSSVTRALTSVYHSVQEDRDQLELVRADEADRSALELLVIVRWDKLVRAVLDHGPFARTQGDEKVARTPCTLSFEIEDYEHKVRTKAGEKVAARRSMAASLPPSCKYYPLPRDDLSGGT